MALRFDDLEIFLAVAREHSVTRAAVELHRAQQTVSERISAIERLVGQQLFQRSTRGMELTEAGTRFHPYAQQCHDLLDEGIGLVRTGSAQRTLTVLVHASAIAPARSFLARVMQGYELVMSSHRGRSRDVMDAVATGTADLAIGPFHEPPDDVTAHSFALDPLACVVPATSALADRREIWLDELACHLASLNVWGDGGDRLILPGRFVAPEGARQPTDPQPEVQVCARSAVVDEIASGALVELNVPDLPQWNRVLKVAYRTDDGGRPPMRAIQEAVSANLRSGVGDA